MNVYSDCESFLRECLLYGHVQCLSYAWNKPGSFYVHVCLSYFPQHWTKLDTTGGPKPPARDSHAACCIAGPLTGQGHPLLLLVGGGYSFDDGIFKDMWVLDVDRGA